MRFLWIVRCVERIAHKLEHRHRTRVVEHIVPRRLSSANQSSCQGVVAHISELFCGPNCGLPARPTSVEFQGVSCSKDCLQAASNLERRSSGSLQTSAGGPRLHASTMPAPNFCGRQRPRAALPLQLPLQLKMCVESLSGFIDGRYRVAYRPNNRTELWPWFANCGSLAGSCFGGV